MDAAAAMHDAQSFPPTSEREIPGELMTLIVAGVNVVDEPVRIFELTRAGTLECIYENEAARAAGGAVTAIAMALAGARRGMRLIPYTHDKRQFVVSIDASGSN